MVSFPALAGMVLPTVSGSIVLATVSYVATVGCSPSMVGTIGLAVAMDVE